MIDEEPYSPLWVPEEDAPVEYRKRGARGYVLTKGHTARRPIYKAVFYPVRFDRDELLAAQTIATEHKLDRERQYRERQIEEADQRIMHGWPEVTPCFSSAST